MNELIFNIRFGEDVESQADKLLLADEEYQARATPLKSMQAIKELHRQHIINTLKMKELQQQFLTAEKHIRENISLAVTSKESYTVLNELNQCDNLFESFKESLKEAVTLQSKCGFSNETLTHIYKLAKYYVEKERYHETIDLIVYLIALNPVISIFWRSLGLCLKELGRNEEAEPIFKMAKALTFKEAKHGQH